MTNMVSYLLLGSSAIQGCLSVLLHHLRVHR
uniref:Uncharacterized protein n=1 Tax=Arundo donax TaxID=35708 RepID=A0A0A9GMD3_ARUDO